jgi:hypothetical protein
MDIFKDIPIRADRTPLTCRVARAMSASQTLSRMAPPSLNITQSYQLYAIEQ